MLSCETNCGHNTCKIFQHIVVGKTEDAISARGKPVITSLVVPRALNEIVTLAIDLDNEFARMRDKIRDIATHRSLAAKP